MTQHYSIIFVENITHLHPKNYFQTMPVFFIPAMRTQNLYKN